MSVERWLAIVKPFYYKQYVTGNRIMFAIGGCGLFCLLHGTLPLIWDPVVLMPGWYCVVGDIVLDTTSRNVTYFRPDIPEYHLTSTATIIGLGIAILVYFTGSVIIVLTRKSVKIGINNSTMERRFAKLMGVIGLIFLLTWIPYLVCYCLKLHTIYKIQKCKTRQTVNAQQ